MVLIARYGDRNNILGFYLLWLCIYITISKLADPRQARFSRLLASKKSGHYLGHITLQDIMFLLGIIRESVTSSVGEYYHQTWQASTSDRRG